MSDEWRELLELSASSTKAFCPTFLPEYFDRPFAALTEDIFKVLDDPSIKKVVIAAPRGWGKTTINTIGYPAKKLCFREKRFIVTVSATADKAKMDAKSLKTALLSSSMIKATFGNLKENSPLWSETQFQVGRTLVMPRGAGQQVRGMNHEGSRPDLIIVDDLETSEGVMNENSRAKLEEWFFSDLCNSVDRSKDDWKIVVIGTVLHEDSLLEKLLNDPTWHKIRISLCDDSLKSNWPEFLSDEQVRELYEDYRAKGMADVFAREYQNKPISGLDATFRSEHFQYYEPADILDNRDIYFVTIVDPAKTVTPDAADSAIVTVGIDLMNHKIYFHDCFSGKIYPDQLYDEALRQVAVHGSNMLAIEVTSLNEFITQPLKNEMRKRGVFAHLVELKARDSKHRRVAQLAPYYRQGYIYHNGRVSPRLEMQLTMFPRSALWDIMDAFAYVIEVMELDERYFHAPELPEEDEYSVLDNEEELAEWRTQ